MVFLFWGFVFAEGFLHITCFFRLTVKKSSEAILQEVMKQKLDTNRLKEANISLRCGASYASTDD